MSNTREAADNETFQSIGDWLEDTFGKNGEIAGCFLAHFYRVKDEFNELDSSIEKYLQDRDTIQEVGYEAADVVIALAGMCRRYNIDLQQAINTKMKINRERQWEVFSNGTGRHIKSEKNFSHTQSI